MKGKVTSTLLVFLLLKKIQPIFMDSILLDIKSKLTDLIANSSRKGVFRSV